MNERFLNKLINGDCYEVLPDIEDCSIDLILTDPPYNTTNCGWECAIDIDGLFTHYKRVVRNPDIYRYSCVWVKPNATTPHLARVQPMRRYEDIMVFYKKKNIYNPILSDGKRPYVWRSKRSGGEASSIVYKEDKEIVNTGQRFPTNVFEFKQESGLHSTKKPVPLFEYIIQLYTNEGMVVLDTFMGSGTAPIACINTNRTFIGIEKDNNIFSTAEKRVAERLNLPDKVE